MYSSQNSLGPWSWKQQALPKHGNYWSKRCYNPENLRPHVSVTLHAFHKRISPFLVLWFVFAKSGFLVRRFWTRTSKFRSWRGTPCSGLLIVKYIPCHTYGMFALSGWIVTVDHWTIDRDWIDVEKRKGKEYCCQA